MPPPIIHGPKYNRQNEMRWSSEPDATIRGGEVAQNEKRWKFRTRIECNVKQIGFSFTYYERYVKKYEVLYILRRISKSGRNTVRIAFDCRSNGVSH